jgi:hypothetical protein
LAVWLGVQVFFPHHVIDWFALTISAVALFGLLRWKWNVIAIILGSGLLGLLFKVALAR